MLSLAFILFIIFILLILHLLFPAYFSKASLFFYLRQWQLFRRQLINRFESSSLGRWIKRSLREHLISFCTLFIYLTLILGYYEEHLELMQVLSFGLIHLFIMRQLRFNLQHIRNAPQEKILEIYYGSIVIMYIILVVLATFFFSDYYCLFERIVSLRRCSP